ncbi:SGNH hydrolase-type esterase domain-containing protein [Massariosphaeria phaeospora]|uniref:SGNH hydrolase-type esterase domain-containing protein n=1 Tax=Massariosphaeria phaeospora TaxID=100035 RepID=A0A7C8MAG5_9PLEO|nr:SGNH hydrolase-type esterase domain-containing protein [Massariosphaeria phaeospora]
MSIDARLQLLYLRCRNLTPGVNFVQIRTFIRIAIMRHFFHSVRLSLLSTIFAHTYLSSAAPAITSHLHPKLARQDNQNPWDQSWIRKWTAIGDSYSAGIGAGQRLDADCARYDQSYPMFIQNEPDMGDAANRQFTYLSCSGAVSKDMLANQIPKVPDGQDVITISAGGNDVGLADILNHCIFQWLSTYPTVLCNAVQLTKTDGLIDTDLPGNLDALLAAAKTKLTPGGTMYVTGYARFWGENSQCDGVTWSLWPNNPAPAYLGLGKRQTMNYLVTKTNQRIREAVERAGSQAVFVDYDEEFELMYGRFCEDGVAETDANRENLLFYQWHTIDEEPSEPGRKRNADDEPGTFGGNIDSWIEQALEKHPDWAPPQSTEAAMQEDTQDMASTPPDPVPSIDTQPALAAAPQIPSHLANFTGNSTSDAVQNNLAVLGIDINIDGMKRVFHPRPLGHAVIAQLVLWHMAQRRAQVLGLPSDAPELATITTCAAGQTSPMDLPTCGQCSEGGGSTNGGSCMGGTYDKSLCCSDNPFRCGQTGCMESVDGKCQGQYQGCACYDPSSPSEPPPPPPPPTLCNVPTDGWTCAGACNGFVECQAWCNANCNCMPNC